MSDLFLVIEGFALWGGLPVTVLVICLVLLGLRDRERNPMALALPAVAPAPAAGTVFLLVGEQSRERCDYRNICGCTRDNCCNCALFESTLADEE
jgi:hypothetical protein